MIYLLKSIPLSDVTRKAWREAGVTAIPRKLASFQLEQYFQNILDVEKDVIINYGRRDYLVNKFKGVIYNRPDLVSAVYSPGGLRKLIPDFLPPQPIDVGSVWIKGPGSHGYNKQFWNIFDPNADFEGLPISASPDWDIQKHIDGPEYRVITVGKKVVQASKKEKGGTHASGFSFTWVGVGSVKGMGIIPLLHKAVGAIPGGDRSILGWDIIVGDDKPYIIETNTSPGVNEATALRIVKEIRRVVNI